MTTPGKVSPLPASVINPEIVNFDWANKLDEIQINKLKTRYFLIREVNGNGSK